MKRPDEELGLDFDAKEQGTVNEDGMSESRAALYTFLEQKAKDLELYDGYAGTKLKFNWKPKSRKRKRDSTPEQSEVHDVWALTV